MYGGIAAIALTGILLYVVNRLSTSREHQPVKEPKHHDHTEEDCAEGGCGLQSVCNKNKKDENIVYFEDEELDAYKDRPADAYEEQEVELFDEVLTTLLPKDVAPWLNSLCARQINLPAALRNRAIERVNQFKRQNEGQN